MNAFFLTYYDEHDLHWWGIPKGWLITYEWDASKSVPYPADKAEAIMEKIAEKIGYRSGKLTGFTLFMHPGKGWQMSTQREGEHGYSISIIPDEDAQAILSLLQASGHPDGPYAVKSGVTSRVEDIGKGGIDYRKIQERMLRERKSMTDVGLGFRPTPVNEFLSAIRDAATARREATAALRAE